MFYDLGSGSGKVLIAASLSYSFFKCTLRLIWGKGIEYLESLYDISMGLKRKVEEERENINQEVSEIVKADY